jgi:hypothetical protein
MYGKNGVKNMTTEIYEIPELENTETSWMSPATETEEL